MSDDKGASQERIDYLNAKTKRQARRVPWPVAKDILKKHSLPVPEPLHDWDELAAAVGYADKTDSQSILKAALRFCEGKTTEASKVARDFEKRFAPFFPGGKMPQFGLGRELTDPKEQAAFHAVLAEYTAAMDAAQRKDIAKKQAESRRAIEQARKDGTLPELRAFHQVVQQALEGVRTVKPEADAGQAATPAELAKFREWCASSEADRNARFGPRKFPDFPWPKRPVVKAEAGAGKLTDDRPDGVDATEPKPIHSADFTFVRWFGTEYTFALGVQSQAVQALWNEWEKSGLGLHQETIRDAVDPERPTNSAFRMDKVFRDNRALGTMIQKVGDGKYKLAQPNAGRPVAARKGKKSARTPAKARRKPR